MFLKIEYILKIAIHTHTGWLSATDASGAFLIDRSSTFFEPLLNFMRHGKLIINEGISPIGNARLSLHPSVGGPMHLAQVQIFHSLSLPGVLEEAKFFGISKAIEPLEALVRVSLSLSICSESARCMSVCVCTGVCVRMRSCLPVAISREKSFFNFSQAPLPLHHFVVR